MIVILAPVPWHFRKLFPSHEAPSRNSWGVSSAKEPERLAAACSWKLLSEHLHTAMQYTTVKICRLLVYVCCCCCCCLSVSIYNMPLSRIIEPLTSMNQCEPCLLCESLQTGCLAGFTSLPRELFYIPPKGFPGGKIIDSKFEIHIYYG